MATTSKTYQTQRPTPQPQQPTSVTTHPETHKIAGAHQGEKRGFGMGSIRGSSEAEMGLAAWIEGREERLGLRDNEGKKKKKRRQRQRCRRGRKSEPDKK